MQQQRSTVAKQLRNTDATARATEKYEASLRTIPPPGTGCHAALLGVANLGVMAGINEHTLLADIRAAIPLGRRRVPDSEIMDAIHKAQADVSPIGDNQTRQYRKTAPVQKPAFKGMTYRNILIQQGQGALEIDFMELSGGTLPPDPSVDAVYLLTAFYKPQDILFTGDVFDTQVDTAERILERIQGGAAVPPHIIPNPMTGAFVENGGKGSFRCDAAVAQHRFSIVEFDDMARPDQLAFWHSIIKRNLLPVAALVDSGNKSIHAWLEVNLPDAAAWQREVRDGLYHPMTGRMSMMGADRACQNPARLSRMPGHKRGDKWQSLIYLNRRVQPH